MLRFALAATATLASIAVSAQNVETSKVTLPTGDVVASGKWTKAAPGSVDIPFNHIFAKPPIVVVTGNWRTGVNNPETIVDIKTDRFTVNSINAAPDFQVSWVAVGK